MASKLIAPYLLAAAAVPAIGQTFTEVPGTLNTSGIVAGTYNVDPAHTQVAFSIDHMGFSVYHGLFGASAGTLNFDPAAPDAAKVAVEFPIAGIVTTSATLNDRLKSDKFFDAVNFPMARFESTSVVTRGSEAKITGNLTLKGVTKPVTLDARFTGTGKNPLNKLETVGFSATTSINRSDFGISFLVPMVADKVDLKITAAFEKPS